MNGDFGNRTARCVISLLLGLTLLFAVGVAFGAGGGGHGEVKMATHLGIELKYKVWDLIFRIVNFGVLAVVLIYLIRKPMAQALASRRQGIKDQLADLEKERQEAEKELAEQKQKLARLDKAVEKIVAEYVKEGEAAKARIIEEAKAVAEKLQEQANKNIAHELQRAKQQLKAEMAEEAVAMAEGIIKRNIDAKDQKRIVDEYLTKVVMAQ